MTSRSSTGRYSRWRARAPPRKRLGGLTGTGSGTARTRRSWHCGRGSPRTSPSRAMAKSAVAVRGLRPISTARSSRDRRYYPAINAATLWLVGGDRARARRLAETVVDVSLPAKTARTGPPRPRLRLSSYAAISRPRPRARAGGDPPREDYGALARTRRQLRMICEIGGSIRRSSAPSRPRRRPLLRSPHRRDESRPAFRPKRSRWSPRASTRSCGATCQASRTARWRAALTSVG